LTEAQLGFGILLFLPIIFGFVFPTITLWLLSRPQFTWVGSIYNEERKFIPNNIALGFGFPHLVLLSMASNAT
jgi:hypothetical protein